VDVVREGGPVWSVTKPTLSVFVRLRTRPLGRPALTRTLSYDDKEALVAAPVHPPLPALCKRDADPSADRRAPIGVLSAEGARAEAPLTSEPPLPDAEPLTSEPPLADAAPLTSEPLAAGPDPMGY
jgi:hypothetical protein